MNVAADLFALGWRVTHALPTVTLRPTDAEMKAAAAALQITQALAWRAWTKFTWG